MTDFNTIPDAHSRRLAVTTFDRNVVVVAGAGTGKTTLLVNRFVHTLMREPDPARITEIVALTFTNKAATEMKMRLRERLTILAGSGHNPNDEKTSGIVSVEELRQEYQLSSDQVSGRARAALLDLEKAQIGTVHSFAAHLLRLNPIESGVDPLFQEDDGSQFEHYFNQEWEFWLDRELGPHGSHHSGWRRILADLGLEDIRQAAVVLCNEIIDLDELRTQVEATPLPGGLKNWLVTQHARITALLAQYDGARKRKIDSALAMAREVFQVVCDQGLEPLDTLKDQANEELNGQFGKAPSGWEEQDFREARRLISLSKTLISVDHKMIGELLRLLFPFIHKVRKGFREEGLVTFDGLLARANVLLRHHRTVRERLKTEYKAILVDEFQDTDPLQYEIILYLAERAGSWSRTWKEVDLEPGKLYIVGDPKQSIYAFRRADLEAYDQVVQKVKNSGGVVLELSTNFRSHQNVLSMVNAIFGRVLQPLPNVQPGNVHLMTQPNRIGEVTQPGVELHVVKMDWDSEEAFDSTAATRLEAESLAAWIKENLLGKARLIDRNGRSLPLQPGHIGFLLRKLTQAQDYLDALRRYDIPYVTDGEKHYYRRQEVIDFINLLRVIENPADTIALIGVLRSPLGALTDQEINELRERQALDYRLGNALENWTSPRLDGTKRLYTVLTDLGKLTGTLSIPAIIDVVFSRLPILELAMASLHREQAVANLMKFRDLAERVADRPHVSFNGFIDLLIERLTELREESEGGATEESLDAIRVLTVHKAKGLEFPVVILPGLHHGTNLRIGGTVVSADWGTGTIGMALGERGTVGSVLVKEKLRIKEEAEQRRVLYVAMTRAKERLILSCGVPDRLPRGSFLGILKEAADSPIGSAEHREIQIGEMVMPQTIDSQPDPIAGKKLKGLPDKLHDPPNMEGVWKQWNLRERRWNSTNSIKRFLTPTSLLDSENRIVPSRRRESPANSQGRVIGTLAHSILEVWDFTSDFEQIQDIMARISQGGLLPEFTQNSGNLQSELLEIFRAFHTSEPYRNLQGATIVGREIPFVIPWDCSEPHDQDIKSQTRVMEGVIDLAYKLDGDWWIADYKTDYLEDGFPTHRATKYEEQAKIYRDAAAQCLGLTDIGCQLIFIRHGISIEL